MVVLVTTPLSWANKMPRVTPAVRLQSSALMIRRFSKGLRQEKDHEGDGVLAFVGHGEFDLGVFRKAEAAPAFFREKDLRLAGGTPFHFNLFKPETVFAADFHGLHHGLFGGKPGGIMFKLITFGVAVSTLVGCKNPVEKTLTVAASGLFQALDAYDVNALPDLHEDLETDDDDEKKCCDQKKGKDVEIIEPPKIPDADKPRQADAAFFRLEFMFDGEDFVFAEPEVRSSDFISVQLPFFDQLIKVRVFDFEVLANFFTGKQTIHC